MLNFYFSLLLAWTRISYWANSRVASNETPWRSCDIAVVFLGDQLVQCIELAEEYLLGRMKHACTQYILTEADNAELNDCLLYLRLAHQFQLTDVENKVLELTYQRSTADILACTNYDIASAAPLIIKHAQWLEERVELYTDRIARIKSSVHSVSYDVTKNVSWLVEKVRHATKYTRYNSSVCGNGHSLGKTRGERFFKPYDEKCKNCSYLALGGVQLKLNEICAEGSNTPHFLHGIENKLGDIKKYCDAWFVSFYQFIVVKENCNQKAHNQSRLIMISIIHAVLTHVVLMKVSTIDEVLLKVC